MISLREYRAAVTLLLITALACSPARALVTFDDGHDKIYVTGSVSVSRDSNIFANSDNRGDYVYSSSLSAEYTRRAGWIGVNANASVGSSHFARIKGQDFNNPSFGLEFTKQTGRTTGSLTFSAARESRADAAVNLRSTSWNIPVGLNFKYPITGPYTLSGSFGYASRRYLDETVFASLTTYSASVDLYRILSTERELIGGYRYRYNETSKNTSSTDHSVSLGLSGKLIRGVTGSLRVGYQTRVPSGGTTKETRFDSWTASGSSSYAVNKKTTLTGSISKDFSVTATDSSVDTTAGTIDLQYNYNAHWALSGEVGAGDSRYLGEGGRIVLNPGPPPLLGTHRHDDYVNGSASLSYSLNEHLKAGLSYSWFKNWSTSSYADFIRSSWSFSASSRW